MIQNSINKRASCKNNKAKTINSVMVLKTSASNPSIEFNP